MVSSAPTPTPANGNGRPFGREWVAIILAVGIVTAVNLVTFGVLYDAIVSAGPGLSDNATQVLTLAFGGIIGLLGSYLGYKAGQATANPPPPGDDGVTPPA